jgi:hypothetical protein
LGNEGREIDPKDANARDLRGHNKTSSPPTGAGTNSHVSLGLNRLMDERAVPYPLNLVLYMQLAPFEFRNRKVIGGGVCQRFVDFLLERLVPFFEFRKMRFNRHVACLLASVGCRSSYTLTTKRKDTLF